MITSIKKIKGIGVFSDYEIKKTGLSKDFGKRNLIYGLNTYGKSTLCDIIKDIADNKSDRIQKRLTIPGGMSQEVVVNLSDGEGVLTLNGNNWNNNKLANKVMVFDTEFMIKNVFDGTELIEDRTTKENFTDFILGDEGVAVAQEIEELKRQVKDEKSKLQAMVPYSMRGHSDAEVKKYIKQVIEENLEDLRAKEQKLIKQIEIINQREKSVMEIRSYKNIDMLNCNKLIALCKEVEKARCILETHYSMSANTLVTFQQHVTTACHGLKGAQEWISQGIRFMDEDKICPFCGQIIEDKSLVDAFSEYLSEEYQIFKGDLHTKLNSIAIDWNVFSLAEEIVILLKKIKEAENLFGESVSQWNENIEALYEEVVSAEKRFMGDLNQYRKNVETSLRNKYILCNVAIEIDTALLDDIKQYYDEVIEQLNGLISKINDAILLVKKDVSTNSFEDKRGALKKERDLVNEKISRIQEDCECQNWKNQYSLIEEKNKEIKEKSQSLEQNQKEYLDHYFNIIDRIFKDYGARRFKIERGDFNNKGYKKVFGVRILFNDVDVTQKGMTGSVFSESDKRALALAVFMAKIQCMSDDEKKSIILVLDDPITSFDENRMSNVLTDLMLVSDKVNQMFVFSHHLDFSKRFSDSYSEKINFYKVKPMDEKGMGNGIFDMNPKEELLTGFERAYMRVVKFNDGESNEMTQNDLRTFMEEYLKIVFANQYKQYGLRGKKLGECIDELERYNLITTDIKTSLHYYRNELNSNSHTFQSATIEDDRNFSNKFVNFLFDNVHMG